MTEKKMRKWLKTFIMLLPVVMVALFGVHLHRHDIPNEITIGDPNEVINVDYNYSFDEKTFEIENFVTESLQLSVNPSTLFQSNLVIEDEFQELISIFNIGNCSYGSEVVEIYVDFANENIYYDDSGVISMRKPQFLGNTDFILESYTDDFPLYFISFKLVTDYFRDDVVVEFSFYDVLQNYSSLDVYTDYIVYDEPLEIIGYEFNNYLDQFYKFDIFNLTDFYDWSVKTFFDGTAPLYYKPVFSILVYEFVIELLFLMFSFITFIIRFAQKWIDGLYERKV